MAEGLVETQSGDVYCFDPECKDAEGNPSVAEPEQDGDHMFFTCSVCGSEFGYERMPNPVAVSADGACSLGVPESLRRAASAGMERAMTSPMAPSSPQPVQIQRKRRAAS